MKKVALITGASSGIGESAAILLHNAGYKVYGAARRVEKMKSLEEKGISTVAYAMPGMLWERNTPLCLNRTMWQEAKPAAHNLANLRLDGAAFVRMTGRSPIG